MPMPGLRSCATAETCDWIGMVKHCSEYHSVTAIQLAWQFLQPNERTQHKTTAGGAIHG
jgi:hypothetical protein